MVDTGNRVRVLSTGEIGTVTSIGVSRWPRERVYVVDLGGGRVAVLSDDELKTVTTYTAADAGCLVDGHHGWHAHSMVIDLAIDAGMTLSDDDRAALDAYRSGDPDRDPHGYAADAVIGQGGLLDDAEAWLNEHAAPAGHLFGWNDGEFFLMPTAWWQEV